MDHSPETQPTNILIDGPDVICEEGDVVLVQTTVIRHRLTNGKERKPRPSVDDRGGLPHPKHQENTMPQYQGKTVPAPRDAKAGDPGFDANQDQVVISVDGQNKTVLRTEVTTP